jgi:NAD(P)H dehydrogenase (quinone)
MRILVSGASGYVARHAVAHLLARGVAPSQLILVTRTPARLDALAAQGATVRPGDFGAPDALARAYAGGEAMLFVSAAPDNLPEGLDQRTAHAGAIAAAAAAGVRHVVLQSSLNADEHAPARDEDDFQTEQALRASGMAWTMLRTTPFADSRGRDARERLKAGTIRTNLGDARVHYVVRDDLAEAAAVALTEPGHAGKVYNLLGGGVTMAEFAAALSPLAGRTITVEAIDDAAYAASLEAEGKSPRTARFYAASSRRIREGGAYPPCDIARLVGRPARSLLDLLREHGGELVGNAAAGRERVFT